jgi:hypothetical protein
MSPLRPASLLALALTLTGATACSRAVTFPDDEFRFPAGFSGVAVIIWDQPDGVRLERVGTDGRRFTFPADGVLRLQDPQPPGSRWVKDHPPRFVMVGADGATTPLASFWQPIEGAPQAELSSSFSRQEGSGPRCSGDSILVGFRDDKGKEALRKTFSDRVDAACR